MSRQAGYRLAQPCASPAMDDGPVDINDTVGVKDRSCAVCCAGEFRLCKYKIQIGQ